MYVEHDLIYCVMGECSVTVLTTHSPPLTFYIFLISYFIKFIMHVSVHVFNNEVYGINYDDDDVDDDDEGDDDG